MDAVSEGGKKLEASEDVPELRYVALPTPKHRLPAGPVCRKLLARHY